MEVPTGFFATLRSLIAFLPFFALLLVLGVLKAIIFSPVALIIIGIGNWAVIVGLWPVHLIWAYYCIVKAKLFGPMLKLAILLMLPVPLVLWLVLGGVGSILAGICYGICSPLMATFTAVGEGKSDKFKQCFVSGTWSTVLGSCTVVRDFTDVCYHSYFSTLTEFRNRQPKNGTPLDIKLSQIPGCILVGLLGIVVDVPVITIIAFYKSPYMLFKGWKQLLRDLIGRAGPFLETACVPFAGLSIVLWPLVVVFTILAAILSSFFLGIYASAVVYQESSMHRGLAYIVAAIALFDEYSNDLLYMREGTCFPRPKYRKESAYDAAHNIFPVETIHKGPKQPPQRTHSLNDAWQELKAVQVWNSIFEVCEELGKALYQDGVITDEDVKDWKRSDSRILNIGLPAYVLLQCFLRSIKSNSPGFVLRNGKVLTQTNRPEGRAFDFFFEPMSIMLEQLKSLKLQESEELYLSKLVLTAGDSERMEKWHNGGIPPADEIKKGQLQGISKRIQGFATTLSRMPTFRRRFQDVVKAISRAADEMKNTEDHV